jgi:translation initiation factor 6 (eIF-6)
MDIVRRELAQVNNTVLANIHDAIIVREKLSLDVRNVIEDSMRRETGNVFWRVSQKQIKRFET